MPEHQQSHKVSMISIDMLQSLNYEKTHTSSSNKLPVAVTSPFIHQICTHMNIKQCWSSSLHDVQPQRPSNHAILSVAAKDSKSDLTLNCNNTSGNCLFKCPENSLHNANKENYTCHTCAMAKEVQSHPPKNWKNLSMIDLSGNHFKHDLSSNTKGDNVHYVSLHNLPTVNKEFGDVAHRKPLQSGNDSETQCADHLPVRMLHPSNASSNNVESQHLHLLDDIGVGYGITLYSSDTYSYCASLISGDAGLQHSDTYTTTAVDSTFTDSNTPPTEKECDMSDLLVQTSHHDSASSPFNCENGGLFSPCSSNESGYYVL